MYCTDTMPCIIRISYELNRVCYLNIRKSYTNIPDFGIRCHPYLKLTLSSFPLFTLSRPSMTNTGVFPAFASRPICRTSLCIRSRCLSVSDSEASPTWLSMSGSVSLYSVPVACDSCHPNCSETRSKILVTSEKKRTYYCKCIKK